MRTPLARILLINVLHVPAAAAAAAALADN